MKLEVPHVPDCLNLAPLLQRLAEVTDLPVSTRVIDSDADAAAFGTAGSPTLLIDGVDPFAAADACDRGVSCRLYRDQDGRIVSAPSVEQLRAALSAAGRSVAPGEVLSAWRTRALPLDPVDKSVHQADCCCDYLNFFTDRAAARAWTSTHPHVPGQILDRAAAEDLAVRLFGHLLAMT